MRLPGESGKTRRGDGLAVTLVVLVWNMERDASGQLRELDVEHLSSALDDVVPAWTRCDAPEYEYVPKIVERGEVGHAVAQIRADGLVNLPCAVIAAGPQRLNQL